jgi:hypothetical protein
VSLSPKVMARTSQKISRSERVFSWFIEKAAKFLPK